MRVVDVLLVSDGRTLKQIAEACRKLPGGKGLTRSVLSAYLAHDYEHPQDSKGRPINIRHLKVLAKVVKGNPTTLMEGVDDEELIDAAEALAKGATPVANGSKLSEPPPPAYLPDYTAAEAAKLRVVRSIAYEGEDAIERVIAPQRLAASPPDQIDSSEEGVVSIPKREGEVRNAPVFPVRVYGTSMNRVIPPGAIVFYRRSSKPPQGSIVIATVHGDPPTMKRLRGKKLEPDSTDQQTAIDLVEDAKFIGEVVAIHIPSK